ncbi:MAG: hypothetical protein GTO14_23810 [Anaerolineales bacterium]|nr:hypothetical protein [Anaerolineales bacterium]
MSSNRNSLQELERLAKAAYDDSRLEDCIEHYSDLREAYWGLGDRAKAAEMANNLCVVLLQTQDAHRALEWVRGTPELFLSLGDEMHAAQAFGNLGSALEACDQISDAEIAYREAAELFAHLGDAHQHAYTLQALSRLQLRQGRPMEAVTTMQRGLEEMPKGRLRDRLLRRLLKWPFRLLGR